MCERCADIAIGRTGLARRSVLKLAAAAAAGLTLVPHALTANAKAPPKLENVLSPDDALKRLMHGNARYIEGVSKRHDFKHEREALSAGQNLLPASSAARTHGSVQNIVSMWRAAIFSSVASPAISPATT